MTLLIKSARVIDPANNIDGILDILIGGGVIQNIAPEITAPADKIIDAAGLIASPGFVDMHVHLREPGFEYKEDIKSGTYAAVCGGVTSVVCMPNTDPVVDNAAVVEYIVSKSKEAGYCNVFPAGAITKGQRGEELSEMESMKSSGIIAVSDDGRPVSNSNVMRRAMERAKNLGLLVISHSEDLDLVNGGVMNEGVTSAKLGLRGNPSIAESIAVTRDISIAEYTGARLHIAHVSTAESVEAVRAAKKRGTNVTCETAPHYFSLTEAAAEGYNANAKINPPLRAERDVAAVIEGLRDGTVDAIATDHAPHHIDEKNIAFGLAANGAVGLETCLAAGITYLVKPGHLTLNELISKMSAAPAAVLGLNRGTLAVGAAADIAVFDANEAWTVVAEKLHGKSKNSPYLGLELQGKVKHTVVNGSIVV